MPSPKSSFLAAAIVARQGRDPRLPAKRARSPANAGRAAERGPRLFGEEPLKACLVISRACRSPASRSSDNCPGEILA